MFFPSLALTQAVYVMVKDTRGWLLRDTGNQAI